MSKIKGVAEVGAVMLTMTDLIGISRCLCGMAVQLLTVALEVELIVSQGLCSH
jgi:hypothetical protein